MKGSTSMAYGGVLTALAVVLLFTASVSPAYGWCFCISAGMIPALPLVRGQTRVGWLVYAASSVLALLFLPQKRFAVAYGVLFGIYPMIKYKIERIHILLLEWVCKLLYAAALGFFVICCVQQGLIFLRGYAAEVPRTVFMFAFLLMFAGYDLLFSRIVALFRVVFEKSK